MTGAVEDQVARHYSQDGLEQIVTRALAASGADLARLAPSDLAPVDEFHIGGRPATMAFADQLAVMPGMSLLDIGCGLGGASRYFAHQRGCRVTGIDLTAAYVEVARSLARRVGLADAVDYRQASALSLPFAPATFDGAYMLHVGMNIADKAALFAEVKRVLKPDGVYGIYDIMRESDGDLTFPVPWATTADTSFVVGAATYRQLLESAGFAIVNERSRRDFAAEFFRQLRAGSRQPGGPPPLASHPLMGATAAQKVANMIDNLERGLIAPAEMVCRAPATRTDEGGR
jgi:ubiquinone/menaquinone biosynthesis C-methylase UbiE